MLLLHSLRDGIGLLSVTANPNEKATPPNEGKRGLLQLEAMKMLLSPADDAKEDHDSVGD